MGEQCQVIEFREHQSVTEGLKFDFAQGWVVGSKFDKRHQCAYREAWRTITRRVVCPSGLEQGAKVRSFRSGKHIRQGIQ